PRGLLRDVRRGHAALRARAPGLPGEVLRSGPWSVDRGSSRDTTGHGLLTTDPAGYLRCAPGPPRHADLARPPRRPGGDRRPPPHLRRHRRQHRRGEERAHPGPRRLLRLGPVLRARRRQPLPRRLLRRHAAVVVQPPGVLPVEPVPAPEGHRGRARARRPGPLDLRGRRDLRPQPPRDGPHGRAGPRELPRPLRHHGRVPPPARPPRLPPRQRAHARPPDPGPRARLRGRHPHRLPRAAQRALRGVDRRLPLPQARRRDGRPRLRRGAGGPVRDRQPRREPALRALPREGVNARAGESAPLPPPLSEGRGSGGGVEPCTASVDRLQVCLTTWVTLTASPGLTRPRRLMPWTITDPMLPRAALLADFERGPCSLAEPARRYGVSRKTAHKWIGRWQSGDRSTDDRSRAPLSCPHAHDEVVREAVLELRRRHRTWGPRKLVVVLARERPDLPPVSHATVSRWLGQAGLAPVRRRRASGPAPVAGTLTVPERANHVWTLDFKGHARLASGPYVYPLTVCDAHTRFVLSVTGHPGVAAAEVEPVLRRVFAEHGLPEVIRTDNGVPFVTPASPLGLTRLSAWWLRLGIRP